MLDLAAALKQVRQGMIPAHIYGDPEIFALGRDRLFTRAWVFLAHESEIPDPGDYVVRRVLAARKTCAVARPCRSRSPVTDHAGSYVFLASDRSRGITGTVMHSDGSRATSGTSRRRGRTDRRPSLERCYPWSMSWSGGPRSTLT